ncbi:MAG: type II toxin-antitoxin system VapC family toxin [Methylococcales bacterium]
MPKCKTYVDSNVLIAAFQGKEETFSKAMAVLDDPAREFIVSDFLRLETIPKPTFHKREEEVAFMGSFLESAQANILASPALTEKAIQFAGCHDIHPMDALHLSAALHAEADEFVTLEKPEKPMFQLQELKVTSRHSPSDF